MENLERSFGLRTEVRSNANTGLERRDSSFTLSQETVGEGYSWAVVPRVWEEQRHPGEMVGLRWGEPE